MKVLVVYGGVNKGLKKEIVQKKLYDKTSEQTKTNTKDLTNQI
jgi:hypothetical protein